MDRRGEEIQRGGCPQLSRRERIGLDQGGDCGHSEKWFDSGIILSKELVKCPEDYVGKTEKEQWDRCSLRRGPEVGR